MALGNPTPVRVVAEVLERVVPAPVVQRLRHSHQLGTVSQRAVFLEDGQRREVTDIIQRPLAGLAAILAGEFHLDLKAEVANPGAQVNVLDPLDLGAVAVQGPPVVLVLVVLVVFILAGVAALAVTGIAGLAVVDDVVVEEVATGVAVAVLVLVQGLGDPAAVSGLAAACLAAQEV